MELMAKSIPMLLLAMVALLIVVGMLVVGTSLRAGSSASGQTVRRLADRPIDAWGRLCEKTFFFGHQSVGGNIIEGMNDVIASHDFIDLRIDEAKTIDQVDGAAFIHARVGRNREPESKLAEFREIMENGLGDQVDIALLKFCYADIQADSDPDAILEAYCQTLEALKSRFPNVVFLHVTVPLGTPPRTRRSVLKANVKRLLGRSTVLDDNWIRAQYNDSLRQRFFGKEPLFDLAGYEALGPDGQRHYSLWKGREVPVLLPSYTDDGGHLNSAGRRHVAEQLLVELADLAESRRVTSE